MEAKWYRNRELLIAAREEYGTLAAAARAIGGADERTVQKAWRALGLEQLDAGRRPRPVQNEEALRRLYARLAR